MHVVGHVVGLAAGLFAVAVAFMVASVPVRADPAADMSVLFSDLCVMSRLTIDGLKSAYTRVTDNERPLAGIITDREQIFAQEIKVGGIDFALEAIAPAGSATVRKCRVSGQFAEAAAVEEHMIAMYPRARRTEAAIQRTQIGETQLFSISAQWLTPEPTIGAVTLTVEVFGNRHKATLTAVPAN